MKIYGITNCNTVKKAFDWLKVNHINYEFQDFKKLGVTAGYVIGSSFSYAGACGLVSYNGVTTDPCANAESVAQSGWHQSSGGIDIRDSQTFLLSASYDVTNWASLYLQWVTAGPLRDQANNLYQPFISTNYNAFTNISLGFTVSIGHGDDE